MIRILVIAALAVAASATWLDIYALGGWHAIEAVLVLSVAIVVLGAPAILRAAFGRDGRVPRATVRKRGRR